MSTRYIMAVDENIDKMVMEILKQGIFRTKTEVVRNCIDFYYKDFIKKNNAVKN